MRLFLILTLLASCSSAVREVAEVGQAVIDAKSFRAAEAIVAPLQTDLSLLKAQIGRLERRIQRLERLPKPSTPIRIIKEVPKSRGALWQ